MGVTNVDNLPQFQVQTRLREERQVLNEQKGSQQVTSGNNLRFYLVSNWFQAQKSTADDITLWVTLTSDLVETPLADMIVTLETSPDGVNWTGQAKYVEPGSPNYYVFDARGAAFTPRESRWGVRLSGIAQGQWFKATVQFLANGAGSM
jgi:hypothetical protein